MSLWATLTDPLRRDLERTRLLRELRREVQAVIRDRRHELIAEHAGLYLYPDQVAYLPTILDTADGVWPDARSITGVTVRVEQTGGVYARGTLTRAVMLDGWQKKTDDREVWITVDGPDFQWSIQAKSAHAARRFVALANTTARDAAY